MTDPKRWRDEQEGAAVVAMLDALRADEPTAEAREALWSKLAPILPPTGGGGGSSGGGSALGAKAAMAIGAIGIVTLVAWIATRPPPITESPISAPVSTSAPASGRPSGS